MVRPLGWSQEPQRCDTLGSEGLSDVGRLVPVNVLARRTLRHPFLGGGSLRPGYG
jgi:hypothetical protein